MTNDKKTSGAREWFIDSVTGGPHAYSARCVNAKVGILENTEHVIEYAEYKRHKNLLRESVNRTADANLALDAAQKRIEQLEAVLEAYASLHDPIGNIARDVLSQTSGETK